MPRIPRKIVDDAILISSAHASNPDLTNTESYEVALLLGMAGQAAHDAANLSAEAWIFVHASYDGPFSNHIDAEAEALLRSGWLPERHLL